MTPLALVFLFVGVCYCQVEFDERPRNFSMELLYFTQKATDGHVVISPFGIWTLMTGIALGASGNSQYELFRAFFLPFRPDTLINGYKELTNTVLTHSNGVSLVSKNFVFLDQNFQIYNEFKRNLQSDFNAAIKILDFKNPSSASDANSYIKTHGGRVANVLTSDDFQESKMILANVISFKGLWALPFNKSETTIEPFYNDKKQVIGNVNMMFQKGPFAFSNMVELKSFVVELPYSTEGKYSMLVVLPYPSVKINDMYQNFTHVTLKDIFKKLENDTEQFGLEDVDVKLPRFRISTNVVLNQPLNDMGVYDIFQPDSANFQSVSKDNIFVSAIVHKAEIEVTESGTVASAATTATFSDRISAPYFYANRPFLYFVMEKTTTTVIFSGIYSKPTVF